MTSHKRYLASFMAAAIAAFSPAAKAESLYEKPVYVNLANSKKVCTERGLIPGLETCDDVQTEQDEMRRQVIQYLNELTRQTNALTKKYECLNEMLRAHENGNVTAKMIRTYVDDQYTSEGISRTKNNNRMPDMCKVRDRIRNELSF